MSCGGGDQSRERKCIGTLHSGQYCIGEHNETRLCNTHECPGQLHNLVCSGMSFLAVSHYLYFQTPKWFSNMLRKLLIHKHLIQDDNSLSFCTNKLHVSMNGSFFLFVPYILQFALIASVLQFYSMRLANIYCKRFENHYFFPLPVSFDVVSFVILKLTTLLLNIKSELK